MTLKMTTAQVVETSVTVTNSSFQNYTHPDDHATRTTDTPGFKPFTNITIALEVFNPRFKGNTVTDRDSSLKHISATLARRPNKCITLSGTNGRFYTTDV